MGKSTRWSLARTPPSASPSIFQYIDGIVLSIAPNVLCDSLGILRRRPLEFIEACRRGNEHAELQERQLPFSKILLGMPFSNHYDDNEFR